MTRLSYSKDDRETPRWYQPDMSPVRDLSTWRQNLMIIGFVATIFFAGVFALNVRERYTPQERVLRTYDFNKNEVIDGKEKIELERKLSDIQDKNKDDVYSLDEIAEAVDKKPF